MEYFLVLKNQFFKRKKSLPKKGVKIGVSSRWLAEYKNVRTKFCK